MSNTRTKNKGVSASDWLNAALRVLQSEGVALVKVERLARDLNISKSGFYYHFKNREQLLKQLLEYWDQEFNQRVYETVSSHSGDPEEKLEYIIEMVTLGQAGRFDNAIRSWALHDKKAEKVVLKADKERVEFIASFFKELGFKGDELLMKTFTFYHSLLIESGVRKIKISKDQMLRLQKQRLQMLLS